MDIVEIDSDNLQIEDFDLDLDIKDNDLISDKPSVNFGSGIELLMNDKTKNEGKKGTDININDINSLENELNNITNEEKQSESKKSIFTNLFGNEKKDGENIKSVETSKESIGKASAKFNETKTWDGYSKINNIPDKVEKENETPKLSKEEEMKEKFKYLKKLEELEKKGASVSKRYNMDSDLKEMIGEYESIISEKETSNSIKFQGKMLMAFITGIEFLNNKFDPFDIKLDGWGEQINENIEEYDEIFTELHEKYKSKAKMSPELKLLFQLGGSAIMVHMSNSLFKSSMPGMDDIMRQNPELMKQFTSAAVNTMGKSNPGFGGFMNGLFNMDDNANQSRQNGFGSGANPGFNMERELPEVLNEGPLPPPMESKLPERSKRSQNLSNRPDLMSARGNMSGVNNYGNPNSEENITRPEMKGPKSVSTNIAQNDITSLLNNLKTKEININENQNQTNRENSAISVEDLKDLNGAKIPKSKRKNKSDKNIVSLDI